MAPAARIAARLIRREALPNGIFFAGVAVGPRLTGSRRYLALIRRP